MNGNQSTAHINSDVDEEKNRANQPLDSIIGHFLLAQSNLRHFIKFLEIIISIENNGKEFQKAKILELISDDSEFVKLQVKQSVSNMLNVEKRLYDAPSVASQYGLEIAHVLDSFERLIPHFTLIKEKALEMSSDYDLKLSYERINPNPPLVPELATELYGDKLKFELDGILKNARTNLTRAKKVRREIGIFTIPLRIKKYIQELEIGGKALDFHERFKNELNDPEDREMVLSRIAELDPIKVGGLVDIERGVIYRISGFGRRIMSYILFPATAVAGLGAIYLLSPEVINNNSDFSLALPYNVKFLLIPYVLTIIGVTGHIIKETAVSSLINNKQGFQVVLGRLMLWIHVREFQFMYSVITAIITFYTFVLLEGLWVSELTFILLGYSVDSFFEPLWKRFSLTVSTQTQEIKKVLSKKIQTDELTSALAGNT